MKIPTGNLIVKGIFNHASKGYDFSHFLTTSYPKELLTHANNTRKLCLERFGHLNFKYIQKLHNEKWVEDFPLTKSPKGVCPGFLAGRHPKK